MNASTGQTRTHGQMAAGGFGLNPFQSRQIDRSQPTLLKSIQNVSRFQAAVGNFENVIDIEDDIAGVPAIIAGGRTLYVAAGTMNAYVDLPGLAEKDLELSPDGKSVTVRLPGSQLDKPNLDFRSICAAMAGMFGWSCRADAISTIFLRYVLPGETTCSQGHPIG